MKRMIKEKDLEELLIKQKDSISAQLKDAKNHMDQKEVLTNIIN